MALTTGCTFHHLAITNISRSRNNCSPIHSWEDQIKSPAFTFRFLHRLSDLVQPAILHSDEPRKPLIALCIHMLSLGIIIAPSVLTVNTFSKARRNFKEGKMGKINAGNTWHYTDGIVLWLNVNRVFQGTLKVL